MAHFVTCVDSENLKFRIMDKEKLATGNFADEIFGSEEMREPAPAEFIPRHKTPADIAYQIVKDETFPQTQPRLNLATFVTTYMDEYGTKLMNEAVGINYIDETEYPRVAVMCGRCINMVANMWHTPEKGDWKTGAVGIGSSEACMLGGVAAWLRWRERRKAEGKPYDKPNLVMSSAYQVVWEKFCQLWQIEMRTVPITHRHPTLNVEQAIKMCDENTICVVPIAGVTWTGMNDDIEALDFALDGFNARTGYDIPIHVDAASGGFILPFLYPEKKWDFRLKWVLSISTSGHKYGLVYPGLGWVIWKDKSCLPKDMSFSVNYLGANITQVGLNFSRPAAQILAQYYNFIHLGFEGYKEVHSNSMKIARYCHDQIGQMSCFKNYSEYLENPLFIWSLDPEYEKGAKWTLYDLQDKLMQHGWMVPAYSMPKDIEDMVVMRIVVRQGMSRDMADMLIGDIRNAVAELEKLEYPTPSRIAAQKSAKVKGHVYTH
jgi:glutamate decarboxylase